MLTLRLIAALIFLAPAISMAATLLDARELHKNNPVLGPDKTIQIKNLDGNPIAAVKADHLAALIDAHDKIGAASKINVKLVILVDDTFRAYADHRSNVIAFSSGLINSFGHDKNMLAAVMGHEFAHFSLKHSFEKIANIPNVVRGANTNASAALRETGSRGAANYVRQMTGDILSKSFNRQQEYEADSLGTEYMAKAGYDPKGVTDMFSAMLKATGLKTTYYLDTHPGFEERISIAEPLIANQRYAQHADGFLKEKNFGSLARLIDQWLQHFPESGEAWFYRGVVLKARKNPEALFAFAKAVQISPTLQHARFELCVGLYKTGQERESLVCAEGLALNDERDRFVEQTFKSPIYVGGFGPKRIISDEDALIIAIVLGRPDLAPRGTLVRDPAAERRQLRNQNQATLDARRASYFQTLCERSKNMPNGPLRAAYVKRDCDAYDDAVRLQHLNALNR